MARKRLVAVFVLGLLTLGGIGLARLLRSYRRPEMSAALRGEETARRAGCFACHGPGGSRGIRNPGSASADVPGWDGRAMALYVKSDAELREWIRYGAPRRLSSLAGSAGTALLPMPAYEGWLSDREVEDLAAYLRAASGWSPEIPDDAYEGRAVALRLGCFGCHGPSGMGGLANPGSFKGSVPSWDGDEFAELVKDERELREWILEGRVSRLWSNLPARRFLERQRIQMPAYRRHLSDGELDKLVAYIRRLRGR